MIIELNYSYAARAYSRKSGYACDFSEKGQKDDKKRVKYLKIWTKMYKIWKCFEKGQVIACDYCTLQNARKALAAML